MKKKNWSLKKHVKFVTVEDISADSNGASSHAIYKIKIVENGTLMLKGSIAPQGNE